MSTRREIEKEEEKSFYDDLWKLIIEEDTTIGRLLPGEMTVEMYAERIGKSTDAARDWLNRRVKEGTMEKRKMKSASGNRIAYKPISRQRPDKNGTD